MNKLFEENSINGMTLKNRFVRAATWEGLATEHGGVTPELTKMMVELASGGVGLIISSHTYVSPEGQATPWQLGLHKDELIPGLRNLTTVVHQNGGKIVMQLAHSGEYAVEQLAGFQTLAVSDSESLVCRNIRVATFEDIQEIVSAFASAAGRAKKAGFDGIEIHSGHGYFLSQFLSPAFNRRQDEYGGSITNRTRIHLQIYHAIRAVVGKEYPVLIKMNCADFIDNGLTVDDSLLAAKLFSQAGFDAIEVSGGIIRTGKLSPSRPGITHVDREAYFKDYANRFKAEINTPLILVGGLRSFEVAEKIIDDGIADYISMSRPFIREPGLVNRWHSGDLRKAECTSDNLCFNPGFEGRGVYCVAREIEANRAKDQAVASRFS